MGAILSIGVIVFLWGEEVSWLFERIGRFRSRDEEEMDVDDVRLIRKAKKERGKAR